MKKLELKDVIGKKYDEEIKRGVALARELLLLEEKSHSSIGLDESVALSVARIKFLMLAQKDLRLLRLDKGYVRLRTKKWIKNN